MDSSWVGWKGKVKTTLLHRWLEWETGTSSFSRILYYVHTYNYIIRGLLLAEESKFLPKTNHRLKSGLWNPPLGSWHPGNSFHFPTRTWSNEQQQFTTGRCAKAWRKPAICWRVWRNEWKLWRNKNSEESIWWPALEEMKHMASER